MGDDGLWRPAWDDDGLWLIVATDMGGGEQASVSVELATTAVGLQRAFKAQLPHDPWLQLMLPSGKEAGSVSEALAEIFASLPAAQREQALAEAIADETVANIDLLLTEMYHSKPEMYNSNPKAWSRQLRRALQDAASEGNKDVAQLLLDHDAEVSDDGIRDAELNGHTQISCDLANIKWERQALVHEVILPQSEKDRKLVDAVKGFYASEEDGAPIITTEAGKVAIVKMLLKAKANVNCKELDRDRTPLHTAATRGSGELVRALLQARADPCAEDTSPQRMTPIMEACNRPAVKRILLEAAGGIS
jgi:hypothetical protein